MKSPPAGVEPGQPQAADRLLALAYDELRRFAAFRLAQGSAVQTLQPTALVHEAWLRLVGNHSLAFNDRAHFFRAAAEAMRHILIDRARRKQSHKHGGRHQHIQLENLEVAAPDQDQQLLCVHEALEKLAVGHPVQAELVKLRYFAGMTNEEVAPVLGISVSTAKKYWSFARAWLVTEIEKG